MSRASSRWLFGALFALLLAACGGGTDATSTAADTSSSAASNVPAVSIPGRLSADDAASVAAANEPNLSTDVATVFDIEVLNVANGDVATLNDVVVGDRPVLLWFWSPH